MIRILAIGVALATCDIATAQQPSPNSDAKVAALLAAWEKKRNELPVLKYTFTQKITWPPSPPESPASKTKSEDHELTVEWKTGRYRLVTVDKNEETNGLQQETVVFDGKTIRGITQELLPNRLPKPGPPLEAGVTDGHLASLGTNVATSQLPYISVGHLPNLAPIGRTDQMTPKSPEGLLYYSRNERFRGIDCEVYASYPYGNKSNQMTSEIFTDPSHDSCIVKYACYAGQEPFQIFTISWGQQGNHWLPNEWGHEAYANKKQMILSLIAKPVSVSAMAPGEESFHLAFPEGIKLKRHTVPESKRRPRLEEREAVAVNDEVVEPGTSEFGRSWKPRLLWAGGIVLLAVIITFFWLRQKKNPRSEK